MQPISTRRSPWSGSSPVVSVSKTISRMRVLEAYCENERCRRGIFTTACKMSRICARVWSKPCELSTTKSARRRFSASGICLARMRGEFLFPHAGRARTRVRAACGRRRDHDNGVATAVGAGLEQKRNVEDDDRAPRAAAADRNFSRLCRPADARWPRAAPATSWTRDAIAASRPRSTLPSIAEPGNARRSGPRLCRRERIRWHPNRGPESPLGEEFRRGRFSHAIEPVRQNTRGRSQRSLRKTSKPSQESQHLQRAGRAGEIVTVDGSNSSIPRPSI